MNEEPDPDDIWHEDENVYWGGPLPKTGQGWALAASTYDGAAMWEPEWEAIGETCRALSMLQELHQHRPDWDSLLRGFSLLHVVGEESMEWPPLQDFRDFDLIGPSFGCCFISFTSRNEEPLRHLLYIVEDQPELTTPLLAEFKELTRRLREYPPLAPFVRSM